MGLHYSAAAGGFFDDTIHRALPTDAVPVSNDRHRELLAGQAAGLRIAAGADGKPLLRRPQRTPVADLRADRIARAKSAAFSRIEAVAPTWRQLNALRGEGIVDFAAIDAIRTASDALEAAIAQMSAAEMAQLDPFASTHWPA